MKADLDAVTEKWLGEARENGLHKAMDAYWKEVFPLVKERFVKDNRKRVAPYNALMLTLGTTPQPLILVLEAVRPEKVYFLYTPETENHLSRIIREVDFLRDHEIRYDRDRIEAGNPLELYEKVGKKWLEWSEDGPCSCALCNTGGKKSMVSAAAVAAYFLGIDLIYVDHAEYIEDLRIPKPGTEYLTVLPNPLVAMGDLKLKEARSLFNAGNFESSKKVLDEVGEELSGRHALPVNTVVTVLSGLVEGYSFWDRFHYGKAAEALREARKKISQFDLRFDVDGLEYNLRALDGLCQEIRGKSLFSMLRDHPLYGFRLAVDLYCNARRRESSGLFDDAVVRLYRCIELASQLRLAQAPRGMGGPFNTDDFDWARLDKEVRARFAEISAQVFSRDRENNIMVNLPKNIGLMNGHILLYTMRDRLWESRSLDDLRDFHRIINKRNELMLIHGKKRAGVDDVKLLAEYAEVFIMIMAQEFGMDPESVITEHTFITL